MEGRIGHLHNRYRLASGSAISCVDHLDRLSQNGLAEACAQSLDGLMGGGNEIWIARRVSVQLTLNLKAQRNDGAVMRQWAAKIAAAAAREASRGADGKNLVRFEDKADLVANFIADLLLGQAWEKWFYGCFEEFRDQTFETAIVGVLKKNREHVPSVFARLVKAGSFMGMLSRLGPEAKSQIWQHTMDHRSADTSEAGLRPIFAAALWLGEGVSSDGRLSRDIAEDLFRRFAESLATVPDWSDPAGLARSVIEALEYLIKGGRLRVDVAAIVDAWSSRRGEWATKFEWLDNEVLDAGLVQLVADVRARQENSENADSEWVEAVLQTVPKTTRQRSLLSALAQAVATARSLLVARSTDATSGALDIYAKLIALYPEWSADLVAIHAINGLTATASWIVTMAPMWDDAWIGEVLSELERHPPPTGQIIRRLRSEAEVHHWSLLQLIARCYEELLFQSSRDARYLLRLRTIASLRAANPARISGTSELHGDIGDGRAPDGEPLAAGRTVYGPAPDLLSENTFDLKEAAREELFREERAGVRGTEEEGSEKTSNSLLTRVLESLKRVAASDDHKELARAFITAYGDEGLDLAMSMVADSTALIDDERGIMMTGVKTRCAGLFLLIRAMMDARMAATAKAAGYPLAACIQALGMCWGGEEAVVGGHIDPGISLLAGRGARFTLDELKSSWLAADPASHARFQLAMLDVLVSRGSLRGAAVEVYSLSLESELESGLRVVLFGCENVWPLAHIVKREADEADAIVEMTGAWRDATGQLPELTVASEESMQVLKKALSSLGNCHTGIPICDLTLSLTAISILQIWSKWLRQFSTSSVAYLLQNFIRRPGRIVPAGDRVLVELAPRPLDIVIEIAGYFAPLEAMQEPWKHGFDFQRKVS